MPSQEEYYNRFGQQHEAAILASAEPHLWTTDQHRNGEVYQEMKQRVANQEHFIDAYFDRDAEVLDIGCGFGRQAFLLAKKGYKVRGIDTSHTFVTIADNLFQRHGFSGSFACTDLMKESPTKQYKNLLLLDVLEHIMPFRRRRFVQRVYEAASPGAAVLMTLPQEPGGSSWKKRIKQYFSFFTNKEEHPFPIPQRADVERLTLGLFTIEDFLRTEKTDYYVLRKA